jgi:membrane-associated phospholipid phosphatase
VSGPPGAGRRATRGTLVATLALAPLLTGCATIGGAPPWGERATLAPGRATFGRAVVRAVKAPQTWAPLAAAAVLQIDHLDLRAATWSSEHTPLFGSRGAADRSSDDLVNVAAFLAGVSIVAAPSGEEPRAWVTNKAKGGTLDLAAFAIAQNTNSGLKRAFARARPDRSDHRSFPSGHATRASALAAVTQRNADAALGDHPGATAVRAATFTLAAVCAWSRVEAGRHYPADALAGFALGHLVGTLVSDAFVVPLPVDVDVSLAPGGVGVAVRWRP